MYILFTSFLFIILGMDPIVDNDGVVDVNDHNNISHFRDSKIGLILVAVGTFFVFLLSDSG